MTSLIAACVLLMPLPSAGGPSKSEEDKVTQLVERVEYRNETLRSVLGSLRRVLKSRVDMDVCETYADQPVTVITQGPERLDVILKSLSIQTGAYLRLYVGQHAERARPTFYCERGQGALLTPGDDSPADTTPRWSLVVPDDFRQRHELGLRNETAGELAVCFRSLSLEFEAAGGMETGAIEAPSPHSCQDETTSHRVKGGETFLFAARPELFPTSANPRVSRISVSIYSRCLGPAECPMKSDTIDARCVKGTCQNATRVISPCGPPFARP